MTESIHEWDGAYVLGALSPEDRRTYEQHLETCAACGAAVRELAGVPGILGRLDPAEALALADEDAAPLQDAHVPGRAAGVARRVRRARRRRRRIAAVFVVGVLLVGSAGGWSLLHLLQPAPRQVVAARTLEPVGGSGLSAALTMTAAGWGTRVDWSCDYRAGADGGDEATAPTSYSLVVHTAAGSTTTIATWTSDAGEAKGLVAATAIPADSIREIDIRVTGSAVPLAEARF